jgi:hypothetical protein
LWGKEVEIQQPFARKFEENGNHIKLQDLLPGIMKKEVSSRIA